MGDKPFSFETGGAIQKGAQLDSASLRRASPQAVALTVDDTLPWILGADGTDPTRFPPYYGDMLYVRMNNILFFQFSFSLGAVTPAQGTITLRVPAGPLLQSGLGNGVSCGTWFASEPSPGTNRMDGWCEAVWAGSIPYTTIRLGYRTTATPGAVSYLGYNAPWVWGGGTGSVTGSGMIMIGNE